MFDRLRHRRVAGLPGASGTAGDRGERSSPGPVCPTCGVELVDGRCPHEQHPSHFLPSSRPLRSLPWAVDELDGAIFHTEEVAAENGRLDALAALHDLRLAFLAFRRVTLAPPAAVERRDWSTRPWAGGHEVDVEDRAATA